ncbi:MAG: hypothetical protein ACI3ZD_03875 [Prevotella sp.]
MTKNNAVISLLERVSRQKRIGKENAIAPAFTRLIAIPSSAIICMDISTI